MSYTTKECLQICRKEYPEYRPYAYVDFGGKIFVNLVEKGRDAETSPTELHMIDADTGEITGSLPVMKLLMDKDFREAWKKPVLVKDEVEHGFFSEPSESLSGDGWSVRRSGNELSHHGIPNQKWGVKNGPPYPLDPKLSKQIQNGKNNGLAANSGEVKAIDPLLIEAGKRLASTVIGYVAVNLAGRVIRRISQNRRTLQSRELSKDLIGDISEHKDYIKGEEPKKIVGEHSIEEDMAAINPNYAGNAVPGTTNNCALCAFTYDLRRRGYDVTAKPSIRGNYPDLLMGDMYENPHQDTIRGNNWNNVFEKAEKKYPDGARGTISVVIPYLGGHAMAWEIVNGRMKIIDGQRNVYSSAEELSRCGYNPRDVKFIRTDHLKLKPEQVNRVANELKPDWKQTVRNRQKAKAEASYAKYAPKPTAKMTKQEKRASLERIWMEEHQNTHLDMEAMNAMERWVKANMWSIQRDDPNILSHASAGWGVRFTDGDSLSHYGIKNMRWGVRRFQNADMSLTPEGRERYRKNAAAEKTENPDQGKPVQNSGNQHDQRNSRQAGGNGESSKWKPREAGDLTDEELRRRNDRLQKERTYKDLTTPQWKKDIANIGKEALKTILITAAVTPLAVVFGKKYKFIFAKARDFLHRIVGKPLPEPTNPETYFEKDKKKN